MIGPSAECVWADEALLAEREAGLDADAAARLAVHLYACPRCRGEQLWDAAFVRALHDTPPAPVRLQAHVQRRVRRRRLFGFAALTSAAAGVVLAITLTLVSLRNPPNSLPIAENSDRDMPQGLFAALAPPALELTEIGRQQAALHDALEQLMKEF